MKKRWNWKTWAKAAGVRAVKTFAQSCVSLIPASVMISAVEWRVVLGTGGLAGGVSMVTSLAGIPEVDENED